MRKFLLIFLNIFIISNLFGAFEDNNSSVRATALGSAVTAIYGDVSTIFNNPSSVGFISPDSFLKINFQYANKFGIENYNLYSANLVFPKFKFLGFKTGFSLITEGVSDIISENRFKVSFGKEGLNLPVIKKYFLTGFGLSVNYYSLSPSGYQLDEFDNAIKSKKSFGMDLGFTFIKNNLSLGLVVNNIMFKNVFGDITGIKFGIAYNIPEHSSIISIDFEPVKDFNHNRPWFKLGKLEFGKGIYPGINLGFEKVVKKVLIFRVGLKDFKLNLGLGLKIKSLTGEYSFSLEEAGTTHRIGISL